MKCLGNECEDFGCENCDTNKGKVYALFIGYGFSEETVKLSGYREYYDYLQKWPIESLPRSYSLDLMSTVGLIKDNGVPTVLYLGDKLQNNDSAIYLLKNLIHRHIEEEFDLIKVDVFRPFSKDSDKLEALYNIWWDFHEKYLNKRELNKQWTW